MLRVGASLVRSHFLLDRGRLPARRLAAADVPAALDQAARLILLGMLLRWVLSRPPHHDQSYRPGHHDNRADDHDPDCASGHRNLSPFTAGVSYPA